MSRLSGATMAASRLEGNGPNVLFPSLLLGLSAQMNLDRKPPENQHLSGRTGAAGQLFSSGFILFSNSSIEVSPLIFSPLMKKVGVESTFNTSAAYFWSAASLSSSD